MKTRIRRIVQDTDTPAGRWFDFLIQVLIILSLISFSLSTLPDLAESTRRWLRYFEIFSVMVFTAEYLLRIYVAERKLGYIFSFFGLVDFFAILPFYLSRAVDLRSLRILRLFRVFRLIKILRFQRAIERYQKAFRKIKAELVVFMAATGFMLYIAAVGIYYFEHQAQPEAFKSVFHSLWWAVATLTTVGYGDIYPVTAGGKLFTSLVLVVGLSVVAMPAGLFASALEEIPQTPDARDDERDDSPHDEEE